MTFLNWLGLAAMVVAPAAGAAQEPAPRPEMLRKLVDCRKLADDIERVRCYDREVTLLDEAERKREIVLVDRAEIGRTRRSLFGLALPNLKLLGRGKDEPAFTTIETVLADARPAGRGWTFTLEDGARWIQTDSAELGYTPKRGQSIRIRQGALGSFLANIDKQVAIRVRRIN